MNPRRVHELMSKHFPPTDAESRVWKNIVERDGLQEKELMLLLEQFILGEKVLVEVHRKLGDYLSKQDAVRFVAANIGKGEIHIADREFRSFVVVANNGVATGWATPMTYEEQTEKVPLSAKEEAAIFQIYLKHAPEKLAKLTAANDDAEVFLYLPAASAAAFHLRLFSEAKAFAERGLALAPLFHESWNYGNAIHICHTVLGLVALSHNDEVTAIAELIASSNTSGSPQLNSFGPTMQLAKALLVAGHIEPVLEYLEKCRTFWEMGGIWLGLWERKVREGCVPNFFQHSYV